VVAFGGHPHMGISLEVRTLPPVERDAIVLPQGALERIERHALGPARHRERLLAAGRHLKRGLLMHGAPGTGKTLTAMYLIGRMPGRTTVLLTGGSLGLIGPACALARRLQPATVVLEDVDLVAHQRDYEMGGEPLLFQLLNEMDGLAEDADVLFLLTTNRPDVLEPALAARPGRIDQTVELPLPAPEDRRRLIELYARGLTLRAADLDAVVERLDGASPAHVKELLRKAALLAAEDGEGGIVVEDRHLAAALDELVISSAEVRDSLFGPAPGAAAFPFPSGPAETELVVEVDDGY
jgi:ATP-dependent 26S proteasome regulatory subunit